MSDWDFEFEFDPHDEYFGMTEQQWNWLHNCKVRVQFIPIEDEEDGAHE